MTGNDRLAAAACAALFAAALLLRPQISDALVQRGDASFERSAGGDALRYYDRALRLNPDSQTAADRYVFALLQRHGTAAVNRAVAAADAYLERHPGDAQILADRAMCYLLLKRYAAARSDFAAAAPVTHEPRYYVFAGWLARHERDAQGARRLWRLALKLDAHYAPALAALAKEQP